MRTSSTTKALILITAAAFIAGAVAYPRLPEQIASHWNAVGEADGTMSRFWGVFLFPVILAVMVGLYALIPRIDPLKENFAKFRGAYDRFWIVFASYILYIEGIMLVWNLGIRFDFTRAILPAVGALFIAIGTALAKAERNWFFGIRTPWTLSSDEVWKKTHALGGKLFTASGIIAFIGVIFGGEAAVLLLVVPIVAASVALALYSYLLYRKLPKPPKG